MANKANSLAHTKWLCKYHIVFTIKYRRKIINNQYRSSIQEKNKKTSLGCVCKVYNLMLNDQMKAYEETKNDSSKKK